jgi:hypothetical protein
VSLTRPNHADRAKVDGGKTVRALAPHYGLPYDESWYIMLVDQSSNWMLTAREKVSLLEAEVAGFAASRASQALVPAGKAAAKQASEEVRLTRCNSEHDTTPAQQPVAVVNNN